MSDTEIMARRLQETQSSLDHARDTIDHEQAEVARLRAALDDMYAGWRYIRQHHGDLYGVGWDRCETDARIALGLPDA